MHVRDRYVTAASMIAELPESITDGAPLRVWVAPGSPCASIFVPAFPRSVAGPAPFVPFELSSTELWEAADAVRRRVEGDPDALAEVRATLDPVEDELWAEADEVLERPGEWATVGAVWGARALEALRVCIH
jgi:predicted lipid carrier protein YhbT